MNPKFNQEPNFMKHAIFSNSFCEKKNYFLAITFTLLFNFIINAQNKTNPWQFFIGINAVDTFPTGVAGDLFEEFLNFDHWNATPYPSVIGVKKYIDAGFSFGTRFSVNKITAYGDQIASDNYYNVDGVISYGLNSIFKSKSFIPFLEIGGGYAIFNKQGAGYFNLGAGIEYWLGENKKTGIILETLYKNTGETYGVKHFQHLLGVAFIFGADSDIDDDGILDKQDKCPEIPGLTIFGGCPDQDRDGIQDSEDDCPDIFGLAIFKGCPDSDDDGIADKEDVCPNIPGLVEFEGCPDTDGDGVQDSEDECPEIVGLIDNEGCPKMEEEIIKRLQEFGQIIFFETNKDVLTKESSDSLKEVYSILIQYPIVQVIIEGHTDNVGEIDSNQLLSEKRANKVLGYLIERGIPSSKLKALGYGETRPIRTNSTSEGRSYNRRVEFKIRQ